MSYSKSKHGRVWCTTCSYTQSIDPAREPVTWPKCCGATMTVNGPGELATFVKEGA